MVFALIVYKVLRGETKVQQSSFAVVKTLTFYFASVKTWMVIPMVLALTCWIKAVGPDFSGSSL